MSDSDSRKQRRSTRVTVKFLAPLLIVILAASSCANENDGGQVVVLTTPTTEVASPSPETTDENAVRNPCFDGRLTIGDLPFIDDQWAAGIDEAAARAQLWNDDSRLVRFRVSCALFEPGFRWQSTFYSAEAQALYATDTRESTPSDVDPEEVPTLLMSDVSFALLRESLISIDFLDENELEPSTGVDIRINSIEEPFGPPGTPIGLPIAHVSIEHRGEIKDLFINTETGEIYQYATPGD